MKFALNSFLVVIVFSMVATNQITSPVPTASITPSPPIPSPSATAPPFMLPPTPTPTATPVDIIPDMPPLQIIDADNIDRVQPLFSLACVTPNTALNIDPFRNLLWSPTRNLLAVVLYYGVCLFDVDTPGVEVLMIEAWDTWEAVFSPDGETLATLHNGNKSVRLWDVRTGDEKRTTLQAGYNINRTNPSLAYSPDGEFIATAAFRGGLRLYDAASEELLVQVTGQSWGVYFSGDGTRLVTLGNDGISLWTLHPGPKLFRDQIIPINRQDPRDIALIPGGTDDKLFYYRTENGYVAYDLVSDQIIDVPAFLNDPGFILLSDGTPFPLYTNNPFRFLSPAFTNMSKMAFNHDGTILATKGLAESDVIQLWGRSS